MPRNDRTSPIFELATARDERIDMPHLESFTLSFSRWAFAIAAIMGSTTAALGHAHVGEACPLLVRPLKSPQPKFGLFSVRPSNSSYLYPVDPGGKFVDVIQSATPPAQIADWLRKSIAEHAT